MATAFSKQLLISLCLFLFCGISLATRWQGSQQQSECDLQNLNPLEPSRRIEHEGGVTEFWDENNEQLRCAGVSVTRHIIQPKSLLLPSFNNAPMMVLVIQGRGILQTMMPGCPETYHSFQQPQEEREGQRKTPRDSHQKLNNLRRGDVVALPEGVAHWVYNEGNEELVLVVVHHTGNRNNQLDQNLRRFFLAGNPQQQQQQQQQQQWQQRQQSKQEQQRQQGNNIFQAFDTDILAEAFGVNSETARKLQNQDDWRGNIVRVHEGFRMVRPREQQEDEREYRANGIEETICTLRVKENLANPGRADIYTAQGGSISTLNSFNLPILKYLRLSAGRGNLQPNAMIAPHWNLNAHSISYIARGNARVQIVGTSKRAAFDGELRQGQLLIIPQNFAQVKQAGNEGMEWFTVKTNDQAKSSPLAGKTSVIRAMPVDVLVNAYQVSREEARMLKYNRQEVTILSPRQSGRQKSSPWTIPEYLL